MSASALVQLEGAEGCSLHGKTFPLAFGQVLTFGRGPGMDFRLPHLTMSRRHFKVAWHGCGIWVHPWENWPGIFLNAQPIPHDSGARMRVGDCLITGEARLRLVAAPPQASVEVLRIARSIREGRDYAALPVLADALEEGGFAAPEVLRHCREGGGHDESCWVLDLFDRGDVRPVEWDESCRTLLRAARGISGALGHQEVTCPLHLLAALLLHFRPASLQVAIPIWAWVQQVASEFAPPWTDAVVVSPGGQMATTKRVLGRAIERAKDAGKPVDVEHIWAALQEEEPGLVAAVLARLRIG
jgi:hypothetical protein